MNHTKETVQRADFRPWVVLLICLGVASVSMFFFGIDSPLYTFNSHCDFQWYMTMGHGLVSGKVLYRDLFDHKGPITYLVFGLACLFPHPRFVIWLVEVLCVTLFLYYCYRIARKFLAPWLSLLVVPIMMMALVANYVRGIEGSCVEEFCLPIFGYALLCLLDYLMDRKPASFRRSLTLGICIGILFWTKFTMLEFWIVPLLVWAIVNTVEHKFKVAVRGALTMFAGLLVVTLPIIVWFAISGGLGDLFGVYFGVNFSKYDGDFVNSDGTISERHVLSNFLISFCVGSVYILLLIFGLICFAVANWRQKSGWLLLICALVTWFMVGFFCGYGYYYIPMYAYASLGAVYFVKLLADLVLKVDLQIKHRALKIIGVVAVVVACGLLSWPLSVSTVDINRSRENYAPLVVADLIQEYNQNATEPATLFCYQMADCGFYNAAGIVPNVRYFAECSFTEASFPEMFAAFDEAIRSQATDFVVTYRTVYDRSSEFLSQYYHPYLNHELEASTLPFDFLEADGYNHSRIVVLFRN